MKKTLTYTKQLLDIWLPEKVKQAEIPGACIGVMHKGKLVYSKGFGFADLEQKIPMDWNASMPIASLSKMFTSVAILQLVEAGKVKLTDPVEKYIPWIKTLKGKGFRKPTILDLLTHKSGLKRDGDTYHWIDDQFPDSAQLQQSFNEKTFKLKPGERFAYSNYGYAVLGQIIEVVSGLSYQEYIQSHIFNELKMKDSHFCNESYTPNIVGYGRSIVGEPREKYVVPVDTRSYTPATGIISNISDMTMFVNNIFGKKTGGKNLLGESSKKMLKKDYFKLDSDEFYGLGVHSYLHLKRKIYGHTGGFSGFSSFVGYEPKSEIAVVVLVNGTAVKCTGIGLGIFDAVFRLKDTFSTESVSTPQANSDRNGVYHSRWGDTGILAVSKSYIDFSPDDYFPLKFVDTIEPENKTGELYVKSKSYFGTHKEQARFGKDNDGREYIDYGSSKAYKTPKISS